MDLAVAAQLLLLAVAPTAIAATVVTAPRWCAALARWRRHSAEDDPRPAGPPIERLAADLRRLLRLHEAMAESAHLAMRAHRLWAVETAIGVRAVEAARALDVPHPEPPTPGNLDRIQLTALLRALADAGLVLPARIGPFTRHGPL